MNRNMVGRFEKREWEDEWRPDLQSAWRIRIVQEDRQRKPGAGRIDAFKKKLRGASDAESMTGHVGKTMLWPNLVASIDERGFGEGSPVGGGMIREKWGRRRDIVVDELVGKYSVRHSK